MAAPQAPLMTSAGQDTRPVPDPTFLTTQLLQREMACLREIIETRLDGMDKAIELLQVTTDRFPALVDTKIGNLQELHAERFRSIAVQFSERDTRTEQTSRDSKVAVDAALQAAKEAVQEQNRSSALAIAKSEAATMKNIDQLGILIQTGYNGLNDKIDDLKSRLTLIEGKGVGQAATAANQTTAQASNQASNSFILAVVVAAMTFIGLVGTIIFSVISK